MSIDYFSQNTKVVGRFKERGNSSRPGRLSDVGLAGTDGVGDLGIGYLRVGSGPHTVGLTGVLGIPVKPCHV